MEPKPLYDRTELLSLSEPALAKLQYSRTLDRNASAGLATIRFGSRPTSSINASSLCEFDVIAKNGTPATIDRQTA